MSDDFEPGQPDEAGDHLRAPDPSVGNRPKRSSSWNRGSRPLVAAALVLGTTAVSIGIGHYAWTGSARSAGATSGTANSETTTDANSIAARIDPALVDVNVSFDYQQAAGAGTGIVLTSSGEVLTNNHVVEGATSISVTDVGNGRTYQASVVGYDQSADVAVLQLEGASGLDTAQIGNSSKIKVGETVVAVGNAGGTGGTPSVAGGTVTALNQAITADDELTGGSESLSGLIETDAAIQAGDSGGSLVDASGQVVGMDTAASEGYSLSSQTNQGYAIPIARALSITSQIESGHGTAAVHVGPTAFLGVLTSSTGTSGGPTYYGGWSGYGSEGSSYGDTTSGATVAGVVEGGAAAEAGLTDGDVITSLDGKDVTSASQLSQLMASYSPGQSVHLGWTDYYGQTHVATVTLGSGPAQ